MINRKLIVFLGHDNALQEKKKAASRAAFIVFRKMDL
jgi:hypothetical protein